MTCSYRPARPGSRPGTRARARPAQQQTLAIPGSRAEKTPRWSWNSRILYERSEGRLAGWSASLALLNQGRRFGSMAPRTFQRPRPAAAAPYTRLDASLGYRLNRHWDWALYGREPRRPAHLDQRDHRRGDGADAAALGHACGSATGSDPPTP